MSRYFHAVYVPELIPDIEMQCQNGEVCLRTEWGDPGATPPSKTVPAPPKDFCLLLSRTTEYFCHVYVTRFEGQLPVH